MIGDTLHPATLTADGWENATVWHWVLRNAAHGTFTVIMPDLTFDYGASPETAAYVVSYGPGLEPLLAVDPRVRVFAIIGLMCGAHDAAKRAGARAT